MHVAKLKQFHLPNGGHRFVVAVGEVVPGLVADTVGTLATPASHLLYFWSLLF
jgi:hypothetical protein